MKFSIFNSIIYIQGIHTLIYNAFTGKFIVIKNKIIHIDVNLIKSIQYGNHTLFTQMCEAGVIIDDTQDEISLLQKRIYDADNNFNEYILHINPTLDCNLNCWYCYEKHINHSRMNKEILSATTKYIKSIINNNSIKRFELGFFGGEPLFYFSSIAKHLINYANELCTARGITFLVHFTSNGTLINDQIIRFLSGFSCGFQITLDGSEETHNKTRFFRDNRGSFNIIIANILKLINSNIEVIVRINYTSDNVNGLEYLINYFQDIPEEKKRFLKFDFQRVWQDRIDRYDETETVIKSLRQFFKIEGFTVLANHIPHDIRNSCYGDKVNHILINYDGYVFGCTARDFTPENSIGILNSDGVIEYNEKLLKYRNSSKLRKSICKDCRIAPICGGGCKQRASESTNDETCSFSYSSEDMDNMITDIFEYSFIHNSNDNVHYPKATCDDK